MQTQHNAPHRDARDIGEKSQDIQNNATVAAAKLTARLVQLILERLKNLNLLKGDRPANVSITLQDKQGRTSKVEATERDATSFASTPMSQADLDYIETALRTKAGSEKNDALDRNLTIAVDGKDVLVVKDGEVLRNDLYAEEREVSGLEAPLEAEIVEDTEGWDAQEPLPNAAEAAEVAVEREPDVDSTSAPDPPIVPEVVTEEPRRQESEAVRKESAPVSSVIVILTREIERGTKESPARDKFVQTLDRMGRGSKNFIAQLGERLNEVKDRIASRFRQNPLADRDRQNLSTCATAHKLLDRYGQKSGGKDVFEGNLYRFEREQGQSLSIFAKDGRGCIFQQKEGAIAENATNYDRARFAEIDRRLPSQERSQSNARSRSNDGPELG